MNAFLRRLLDYDATDVLLEVCQGQMQLIHEQRAEMALRELEHLRHIRDLIVQFRQQIEMPEDEVIPGLDAAIVDMNDSLARMEEHIA